MENVYDRLAKHLDRLPVGLPESPNGSALKLLKRWFTEEEASIALGVTGLPEPEAKIAERLKMDVAKLAPVLDDMSKRGLLFRITKGGQKMYNVVPLAEGMWEFHSKAMDEKDLSLLLEYVDFYMDKSWFATGTSQHRVIPIAASLKSDMTIMPYDQAEQVIKSQSKIVVTECVCRKQKKMIGQGCDHPLEVCMAFGTGAFYYLENGMGREVSQDEALKILHAAMDAGLVPQPGNGQKAWNLCLCCGCSCFILNALKKMPKPAIAAHTNFYSAVDSGKCTSCGLCAERCPMEAITMNDTASVNRDRCIGCGVCVGACADGAVSLRQKEEKDRYVPPANMLDMHMRIAKERGLI